MPPTIDTIDHTQVRLELGPARPRRLRAPAGRGTLADQVLDHQLVDVDGVQVIRAADLYLAPLYGRFRLVGVDVSAQSLLRRLGPARWRHTPTPDRVIDWGAIQPFGETEQGAAPEVRLRTTNEGLERLRPGELADLLEDLMRPERQKLLDSLDARGGGRRPRGDGPRGAGVAAPRGRAGPGRRAARPRWSPTRRSTPCAT